jgi:hypothetical protein
MERPKLSGKDAEDIAFANTRRTEGNEAVAEIQAPKFFAQK